MRRILRDNGLLIANLALFVIFLVAMSLAGVREYNADQPGPDGQATGS